MSKSKHTYARKITKEVENALWLIRRHENEMMDHRDRMMAVIRSRVGYAASYEPPNGEELLAQVIALPTVQAISEVVDIADVIASKSVSDFKNSRLDSVATGWIRQLNFLEAAIDELPASAKLPRNVDFVISRAVRNHIKAISRLTPGIIGSVEKIVSMDISDIDSEDGAGVPVIPAQVDAPIMTAVVNDKLTVITGRLIHTSEQQTEITNYLGSQLERVLAELAGTNVDRRTLVIFEETREILGVWSVSKVLAFGAHLCLLENVAVTIAGELAAPLASRMISFLANSQNFVNSFQEWRNYSDQSTVFYLTFEGRIDDVKNVLQTVTEALSSEGDAVESRIPNSLKNFAELAAKPQVKSRALGFVSALSSVKNAAISLIDYAINKGEASLEFLAGSRVARLLRVICRLLSPLLNLAHILPTFSWVVACEFTVKSICNGVSEFKPQSSSRRQ